MWALVQRATTRVAPTIVNTIWSEKGTQLNAVKLRKNTVIPAQAGIHRNKPASHKMDTGLRRYDERIIQKLLNLTALGRNSNYRHNNS